MSADILLSRLDGVRATGPGRWLARCPAHDDKRASLSVRELDDGRVLVHCFASCAVSDVLGAVGLGMDALFPPKAIGHHVKGRTRPFPTEDVFRAIAFEAMLVGTIASRIGDGQVLTEDERARVLIAAARINAAVDAAGLHNDHELLRKHNEARHYVIGEEMAAAT